MEPQQLLGALFVFGVGFFAVLVAIVFVRAHPRISAAYLATLGFVWAGAVIAGTSSVFGLLLMLGLFFPPTAAIAVGVWLAQSKHPEDDLAKVVGRRS